MYVTSGFMERLAELHKYKASDLGLEKLTAFMKPGIDRYKGPEIVPKLLDCMAAKRADAASSWINRGKGGGQRGLW